jgi:hypothetical protein
MTTPHEVIAAGEIREGAFFLPAVQLAPKLYKAVDSLLQGAGGRWDKKRRAHVFSMGEPGPFIERILAGERVNVQKETQFFETPPPVVARLIELAELQAGMTVLEPSAGKGAIAFPVLQIVGKDPGRVDTCELHPPFADDLIRKGFDCWPIDFLTVHPEERIESGYDRVIMNPPFTAGQDVLHVRHAFQFLKPGGLIVSVMPTSWTSSDIKRNADFRYWLDSSGGRVYDLPALSFRSSGTDIDTVVIKVPK